MDSDVYKKAEPLVERAARKASFAWHGVMEYDDVYQELWMYILESGKVQEDFFTRTESEINRMLDKKANYLCKQEQIDYDHFSGNFQYSPKDVIALLGREDAKRTPDERVDLDEGLETLVRWYPAQYDHLMSWLYNSDEWDMKSNSTARVRKTRAVEKLTDCMNDARKWRSKDRKEGLGTKPKEQKTTTPVTDWGVYKQGAIHV